MFLFLYALHVSGIIFSHLQERHYTLGFMFLQFVNFGCEL
jgi:hypothetical protein